MGDPRENPQASNAPQGHKTPDGEAQPGVPGTPELDEVRCGVRDSMSVLAEGAGLDEEFFRG